MLRSIAILAIGFSLGTLFTLQFLGTPAHGEQSPTGYTLDDVYDFIVSNGASSFLEGDHSLYPSGAPGQSGMHTVKEILEELKMKLPCPEANGCQPATGQTKCYDALGAEIDCASVDFPGQDGFYQAGCPASGRYVDNGEGTVSDNCTGLMWQQKDTAPGIYSWQQALQYCENLSLAAHTDWRLPNIRELLSIVDYSKDHPCIDPVFNVAPYSHWSSSSQIYGTYYAWIIDFDVGTTSGNSWKDGHLNYVIAVRGGL